MDVRASLVLLPKLFPVISFFLRNEKATSHKTVQTYINQVLGDEAIFSAVSSITILSDLV